MIREDFDKFLTKLRVELRPAQSVIMDALFTFPHISNITWARGTGKSFVLGLFGFFLARYLHWTVILTAPTKPQCWAIMKWVHQSKRQLVKKANIAYDNRYELIFNNGGEVICKSGNIESHPESVHGHIVIADEKQDIELSVITDSFYPMLADKGGSLVLSGIGGDPESAGEKLRAESDFEHNYTWQEHIALIPHYQAIVEKAKKVMLPEEFAAHYECKALDISAKRLVNAIMPYVDIDFTDAYTTIGIDWGESVDQTIATVLQSFPEIAYISEWLVATGSYDNQLDELAAWLTDDVVYNLVIPERNGVGKEPTKSLSDRVPNVQGCWVDTTWKTKKAQIINRRTGNNTLLFNPDHPVSGAFIKDITKIKYRMTDVRNLKCDHSDFLSSLMLSLDKEQVAYL